MIDLLLVVLFMAQVILLLVIALLVADNNRLQRENQSSRIDAAWCRALLDAFTGKVKVSDD